MATNGRLRDYLTKAEVRALLRAAKQSKRYAARNYAMILLAFRHGFRASALVELRIGDADFGAETMFVRRRKGSNSSVHPMKPDELEAIERAPQPQTAARRIALACCARTVKPLCSLRRLHTQLRLICAASTVSRGARMRSPRP